MVDDKSLSDRVYAFWRALDLREYDKVVSLVSEDCTWQREVLVRGRDAILQALTARPAGLLTRHMVSNLRITDDGAPTAHFMITTFGTFAGENDGSPPDCGGPALIADVEMRFAATGDRTLVTEIRNQIIFRKVQA